MCRTVVEKEDNVARQNPVEVLKPLYEQGFCHPSLGTIPIGDSLVILAAQRLWSLGLPNDKKWKFVTSRHIHTNQGRHSVFRLWRPLSSRTLLGERYSGRILLIKIGGFVAVIDIFRGVRIQNV